MLKKITSNLRLLELTSTQKTNALFTGNYQSAFKGRGIEFADLREYDENDDFRDIDWITSAKQNKLYVKTYHETRELITTLLVDCSASMHFTSEEKNKTTLALETIALLGFSALKSNDPFGIIFFNQQILEYIPPRKGRAHLLRILKKAFSHLQTKHPHKSDLIKTLRFTQSVFKRKGLFCLLTDQIEHSTNEQKYLSVMSKKHDFTPIIFFDPLEKAWTQKGVFSFQDSTGKHRAVLDFSTEKNILAYNHARQIKWQKLSSFFQKNQMDFVEIGTQDNLSKKLFLFFKKRQNRF